MDLGGIGVEGFFAISGFLVTQSWTNCPNVISYLLKRILRLLPGYYLCLLFCLAVVLPLSGTPTLKYLSLWPSRIWINVLSLGLTDGVIFNNCCFFTNPIGGCFNGALWTIPSEARCYLVIAILGVLGALKKGARSIPPLLFFGTYLFYNLQPNSALDVLGSARIITYFFAGTTIYLFRERIPLTRPFLILSLIASAVSCYAGRSWILPFSGTYLLFYAATSPHLQLQKKAPSVDPSYGIYLYGFPIQQLLIFHFKEHLSPILLFLCTLSFAATLGFFSWTFVEAPALRLKRFASRPKEKRSSPAENSSFAKADYLSGDFPAQTESDREALAGAPARKQF